MITAAVCALNFISALVVEGLCCVYKRAEDEDKMKKSEDAIHRAIQNELTIQLYNEKIKRQEELRVHTNKIRSQEERRWKLMSAKNLAVATSPTSSSSSSSSLSSPLTLRPSTMKNNIIINSSRPQVSYEMAEIRESASVSHSHHGGGRNHRDLKENIRSTLSDEDAGHLSPSYAVKYLMKDSHRGTSGSCNKRSMTITPIGGYAGRGNNAGTVSAHSSLHSRGDSTVSSSLSSLLDVVFDEEEYDEDDNSMGGDNDENKFEEIVLE